MFLLSFLSFHAAISFFWDLNLTLLVYLILQVAKIWMFLLFCFFCFHLDCLGYIFLLVEAEKNSSLFFGGLSLYVLFVELNKSQKAGEFLSCQKYQGGEMPYGVNLNCHLIVLPNSSLL